MTWIEELAAVLEQMTEGHPILRFTVITLAGGVILGIPSLFIKLQFVLYKWGKRNGIREEKDRERDDRLARVEAYQYRDTQLAQPKVYDTTGRYSPPSVRPRQ